MRLKFIFLGRGNIPVRRSLLRSYGQSRVSGQGLLQDVPSGEVQSTFPSKGACLPGLCLGAIGKVDIERDGIAGG